MRRVLITGATTPTGRAIVEGLLRDPRVAQVLAVGAEPELPFGGVQGKLTYRRIDLTRARDIRNLLFGEARQLSIDGIIHTALHRSAHDQGESIHLLNVESTREILRLAEEQPAIRRFVFKSFSEVYRVRACEPSVIAEDHPLSLEPGMPQRLRDRIEADLTTCARMGVSRLSIAVLRCSECLAPDSGSQLYDYLAAKACLRPLGYDPMINLISMADLSLALSLALHSDEQGVFNIPGRDTLPLSRAIALAGRTDVPLPGFLLAPLYRLRHRLVDRSDFRYQLNACRFHFGSVLDGRRAQQKLGYRPETFIDWRALFGSPRAEERTAHTAFGDG